jgi:hypothetical protein
VYNSFAKDFLRSDHSATREPCGLNTTSVAKRFPHTKLSATRKYYNCLPLRAKRKNCPAGTIENIRMCYLKTIASAPCWTNAATSRCVTIYDCGSVVGEAPTAPSLATINRQRWRAHRSDSALRA